MFQHQGAIIREFINHKGLKAFNFYDGSEILDVPMKLFFW